MNLMEIKRNTNGDTRVADHMPTVEEFNASNFAHREDVKNMMRTCASEIIERSSKHDWTKTTEPYRSSFYLCFYDAMNGNAYFEDTEWYKKHCELERHHLLSRCPDDVDLFDVIEMVCDCVCAGMARSGGIRDVEISSDILLKATENTARLLASHVILKDGDANG